MFRPQFVRSPNDGGGAPDDKQKSAPTDTPKALTEEDVGRIVNAAVTSHLKRSLSSSLPDAIKDSLAVMNFGQQIEETVKRLLPQQPTDDKSKDDKKPPKDPEFQRQLQDMATKLEASERRYKESEQLRNKIESQRRFDAARTSLTSALKDKAHPDFLDDWVNKLALVEKRLKVADNGDATLRVKRSPFKGAPEEEEDLPIAQAVPLLLERAEEKKYQAVPNTGDGRGTRGPSGGAKTTDRRLNADDPLERTRARLEKMGVNFDDAFGST